MSQSPAFDVFTPEEIKRFVATTGENDFVDAKAPCNWRDGDTKAALAKDFASFANSSGGGAIVLGKEERKDKSFDWVGVPEEQRASFDTTAVSQWVNHRFSPDIRLVCHQVEIDSRWYVVITVAEFSDSPIICTKSYQNATGDELLRKGAIYVRTANAESAPLSTPEQVSRLISRAVVKQQDRLREVFDSVLSGHTAKSVPTDEQKFAELTSAVERDLLGDEHKTVDQGAWKFVIHPDTFETRWNSMDQLSGVMERSKLHRRRFPQELRRTSRYDWGISGGYRGVWCMSHEGLFFFSREYSENCCSWKSPYLGQEAMQVEPGKWIDFDAAVNTMGDFFAFLRQFAQEFDPATLVRYSVEASQIKDRHLLSQNSSDPMEFGYEPCAANRCTLVITLAAGRIEASWKQLCVDALKEFVDYFPSGHDMISRNILEQRIDSYAAQFESTIQRPTFQRSPRTG